MRLLFLAAMATFSMASANAFAYGAAGCGLGSILFEGNNEWWAQTLAATTNGSSGNQTFGITTGTLECDANALIGQMEKAAVFVSANKNSLSNDIAMGEGESLRALSKIMNCQPNAAFSSSLQKGFQNIFPAGDASAEDITVQIYSTVGQNKSCQPLS